MSAFHLNLRATRHPVWVATIFLAVALAMTALTAGFADSVERMIESVRFAALRHDASGQVVVVEMDAASVAEIREWPWPRENYAKVVDNLRRYGASAIVFDVDFSSGSTAKGDAALAAALRRANGLVALPTFSQQAGSADRRAIDALPLPMFRPFVALASVSIAPDNDGVVRTAPLGTFTRGIPRPSLSSYIAGRPGRADQPFEIDYSIRPETIPRLSFIAVREGKFDPSIVRGKTVLIGATAIEMGDRYATPSNAGVIPGVVVQALAAETLIKGVPKTGTPIITIIFAALLASSIATRTRGTEIALTGVAATAIVFVSLLLIQVATGYIFPLGVGLIVTVATALGTAARVLIGRVRSQRLVDEETGLPNKRMLIANGARSDVHLAVIQLTALESIAAVLGRPAVPDLVKRMTDRLKLVALDGQIYRISENLLAFALPTGTKAHEIVPGLRAIAQQPLEVMGRRVDCASALGISAPHVDGLEATITKAALAAEKAAAQGSFWVEVEADLSEIDRSISLMAELEDAIALGDIGYAYQPKYSLAERRIVSVEALARWQHPILGNIRPDHFILLAERTGRIANLTLHLMQLAMNDLAWLRQQGHEISMAINISARLVTDAGFQEEVLKMLALSPVPTDTLIFEITESATLDDQGAAAETLSEFRRRGVTISMDDYGTGQSTLSYLRKLPLGELKIDKSFVENAHCNRNDAVMVRSTIELAHDLGLRVVAEGVEQQECLEFLRSVNCDLIQGYLISKPIAREPLLDLLNKGRRCDLAA